MVCASIVRRVQTLSNKKKPASSDAGLYAVKLYSNGILLTICQSPYGWLSCPVSRMPQQQDLPALQVPKGMPAAL